MYYCIDPLKPNGNGNGNGNGNLTMSNSAFCIYGLHMILSVNMDYFLEQC
jgi:hypothetical protein